MASDSESAGAGSPGRSFNEVDEMFKSPALGIGADVRPGQKLERHAVTDERDLMRDALKRSWRSCFERFERDSKSE